MSASQIETNVEPRPSIKRRVMVVLIPLLIVIGAIGIIMILAASKKVPEITKRDSPVIAVMATPAVSDTVQLKVIAQGEAQPRTEIDLVPEVAGKITYVSPNFLPGGIFKKGDILYKIDQADYKVAVIRAEASVARARQVLVREQAESDIARKDWEDLMQGQASDLTLRKPQLLDAQAGLQSAQADLDNAGTKLDRTSVRAPFNGRVREKIADIGQYVGPGARLGRIFSTDIAEVRIALSDEDLSRLNIPVAFVAKSRETAPDVKLSSRVGGIIRTWEGKIMRTDAAFDQQTRALYTIAEVVDPYGNGMAEGKFPLSPGLYVNATIAGRTFENVIVIPRDGLRPGSKVYVVTEDGISESRDVQVLDANPERAVIASGINIGDVVILSPMELSQLNIKYKAIDVNNPDVVLRDPPPDENFDKGDPVAVATDRLETAQNKFNQAKKDMIESKGEIKSAKKSLHQAKKKQRKKSGKEDKTLNSDGAGSKGNAQGVKE